MALVISPKPGHPDSAKYLEWSLSVEEDEAPAARHQLPGRINPSKLPASSHASTMESYIVDAAARATGQAPVPADQRAAWPDRTAR
ncbi:hypothetical protein E4U53_003111, partial [Claviceps sorghi]